MPEDEKNKKPTNLLTGLLQGVASFAGGAMAIPKVASEIASIPNKIINHAASELANIPGKLVSQALGNTVPVNEWVNPDEVEPDVTSDGEVVLLPIKNLQPNLSQPRKHFDADELRRLSASITENGVLSPLLVRKLMSGKFEIIAGERRYRASLLSGLTLLPVIIKDVNDLMAFELAVIENVQRENLNPVEEAEAYKALLSIHHSQEKVAVKVGKDRSHIAHMLSILSLPTNVLDQIRAGKITGRHARLLIGHEDAEKLTTEILARKLNVQDTEKLIKTSKHKATAGFEISPPPETSAIERRLSEKLHLTVKVDNAKRRLIIPYNDLSLDDVVAHLLGDQ